MKALGIYVVARLLSSSHREALERAVIMAQGGEFAFVLYAAALSVGIITRRGERHPDRDHHHLDGTDAVRHRRRCA